MALHIPPQEDWSPELLSELQKAVPILESSTFDLAEAVPALGQSTWRRASNTAAASALAAEGRAGPGAGGRTRRASPAVAAGLGLVAAGALSSRAGAASAGGGPPRFGGWSSQGSVGSNAAVAGHPLGGSGRSGAAPADPLSDDAMALPMSTLTSGKRRTYPNRSTFQAHICCVMDPLQVPRVLETLRSGPHMQSARHCPWAYRILSPFDGQVHEDFDDDGDSGAGEKMLGLLSRMGLENLLLVVARWDTGPADRLGAELFRCVTGQCKELLRELQQAVRASFPPEELLRRERLASSAGGADGTESDLGDYFHGGGSELDEDYAVSSDIGSAYLGDLYGMEVPSAVCPVDPGAIGPTPPSELVWAARGVCGAPPLPKRAVLGVGGGPRSARGPYSARDALQEEQAMNEWQGFSVQTCPLRERGQTVVGSNTRKLSIRRGTDDAAAAVARNAFAIEDAAAGGALSKPALSKLSEEELVRLASQLRAERAELGGALRSLADGGAAAGEADRASFRSSGARFGRRASVGSTGRGSRDKNRSAVLRVAGAGALAGPASAR
mmetsp:Transcript_5510/g.20812  ORF Transcript_5510/g.20812 Transcript_5510/m.20812 type:complete len:556 (+) Transcript_5510:163-1830(+)